MLKVGEMFQCPCDGCTTLFGNVSRVGVHLRIVHRYSFPQIAHFNKTGQLDSKPEDGKLLDAFVCCGEVILSQHEYFIHEKRKHQLNATKPNAKPRKNLFTTVSPTHFACLICGKLYETESILSRSLSSIPFEKASLLVGLVLGKTLSVDASLQVFSKLLGRFCALHMEESMRHLCSALGEDDRFAEIQNCYATIMGGPLPYFDSEELLKFALEQIQICRVMAEADFAPFDSKELIAKARVQRKRLIFYDHQDYRRTLSETEMPIEEMSKVVRLNCEKQVDSLEQPSTSTQPDVPISEVKQEIEIDDAKLSKGPLDSVITYVNPTSTQDASPDSPLFVNNSISEEKDVAVKEMSPSIPPIQRTSMGRNRLMGKFQSNVDSFPPVNPAIANEALPTRPRERSRKQDLSDKEHLVAYHVVEVRTGRNIQRKRFPVLASPNKKTVEVEVAEKKKKEYTPVSSPSESDTEEEMDPEFEEGKEYVPASLPSSDSDTNGDVLQPVSPRKDRPKRKRRKETVKKAATKCCANEDCACCLYWKAKMEDKVQELLKNRTET